MDTNDLEKIHGQCDTLQRYPRIKSWEESKPQRRSMWRSEFVADRVFSRYGIRVTPQQVLAVSVQNQNIDRSGGYRSNGLGERTAALVDVVNANNTRHTIEPVTVEQVRAAHQVFDEVQRQLNHYDD